MKHVIETGSDAASLCLFDPATLPPDFDERARRGAFEEFEKLADAGTLWWCNTGGDGGYLVHVYVDESVPAELRPYLYDAWKSPHFPVPSGILWACGAEYVARDPEHGNPHTPKGGLAKYSHMGGQCRLPAGEYELTAWRAQWPDGMLERELGKTLGSSRMKNSNRLGLATGVTLFAAFAVSIITLGLTIGALGHFRERLGELGVAWGGLAALWLIALRLARAMSRRERDPQRREVEQRFPSIVVHLLRKSA